MKKNNRKAASVDVCDAVVFRIFMILNIKNCPICQDYNKIISIRVYKCVFVFICWYPIMDRIKMHFSRTQRGDC